MIKTVLCFCPGSAIAETLLHLSKVINNCATMHCPFCNAADSIVIVSSLAADGCQIRRRRECVVCGERFTTFESYEGVSYSHLRAHETREELVCRLLL